MEKIFVGLDVHKKTIQVSVMDGDGNEVLNKSIQNTPEEISATFGGFPRKARMVMESSSVWKAPFFQLRDDMGFDVALSHPYATRMIARSNKKTDKIDARILADLYRGNHLVVCHVPSRQAMANRDLVRHRRTLVRQRTGFKNSIHGILLQMSAQPTGTTFSRAWAGQIRHMGDYRTEAYLDAIDYMGDKIALADARVRDAVRQDRNAQFLKTVPGVGDYTALTISAEIDDIGRFAGSNALCAYAGIVPSVRASGDKAAYGHITRQGSDIMRWVLVQAVHSHVRYAKGSALTAFYRRIARKRGNGIAAVAAASKMLRVMYWLLREQRGFVPNYGQGVSCAEVIGEKAPPL